jgi:predicted nuclease with TOPRIM domain
VLPLGGDAVQAAVWTALGGIGIKLVDILVKRLRRGSDEKDAMDRLRFEDGAAIRKELWEENRRLHDVSTQKESKLAELERRIAELLLENGKLKIEIERLKGPHPA